MRLSGVYNHGCTMCLQMCQIGARHSFDAQSSEQDFVFTGVAPVTQFVIHWCLLPQFTCRVVQWRQSHSLSFTGVCYRSSHAGLCIVTQDDDNVVSPHFDVYACVHAHVTISGWCISTGSTAREWRPTTAGWTRSCTSAPGRTTIEARSATLHWVQCTTERPLFDNLLHHSHFGLLDAPSVLFEHSWD